MITVLAGDNDYEIARTLNTIVQAFITAHGELALEKIDPAEVDVKRLHDAVHSVPFLASRKMVVINGAPAKEVLESIVELDAPDSTDVVLSIGKPDKRAG